ncbi:unnamed protein product [Echinostoma caproni]|uniref:BTB domain-containing protein n=1 Tax=Echinostoma caproni TaxID=27848 RepID=A0A183BBA6_9TREM|nr:unnamed protein product [Echinostoma caproni]
MYALLDFVLCVDHKGSLSSPFSLKYVQSLPTLSWVLIDRSGKHFGTLLNYIRDGSVPLPESKRELEELLAEARFFCVEGLRQLCEDALSRLALNEDTYNRSTIIIVKCPNAPLANQNLTLKAAGRCAKTAIHWEPLSSSSDHTSFGRNQTSKVPNIPRCPIEPVTIVITGKAWVRFVGLLLVGLESGVLANSPK